MVCYTHCRVLGRMWVGIFLPAFWPSAWTMPKRYRFLLTSARMERSYWGIRTGWFAVLRPRVLLSKGAAFPAVCVRQRARSRRLILRRIMMLFVKQLATPLRVEYAVQGCWIVLQIWSGAELLTEREIFRKG